MQSSERGASDIRRRAALVLAAAFAVFVPLAAVEANHSQTGNGKTIVFDHKSGNEWWVEVVLTGASASSVSKVQGMDTGGPWVDLPKKSWGAHAASFHIEVGHQVRFQAFWADGSIIVSCWFTHPAGAEQCSTTSPTPTTSPPPTTTPTPGAFDATFTNVKGNTWWEEAKVTASGGKIAGVDVRMNGADKWNTLSLKSWGAWAGSYHAPDGTIIQFRARSTIGAEDLSGCYRWVAATPTSCPSPNVWPREGSYARYHASYGVGFPNYADQTEVNITLTFQGGRWEARCEGTYEEWNETTRTKYEHFDVKAAFPAPRVFAMTGATRTYGVTDCARTDVMDFTPSQVNPSTYPTKKNGRDVVAPVLMGEYDDGCCSYTHAAWHQATGLVLRFGRAALHSGGHGDLIDTDAPIAPGDPAPTPPSGASWPTTNSFIKYTATFKTPYGTTHENTTYSYSNGRWTQVSVHHYVPNPDAEFGGDESTETFTVLDAVLPRGPLAGVTTGTMAVTAVGGYDSWVVDTTTVRGQQSRGTTRNGAAITTTVWWSDEQPDNVGDDDTWWSTKNGLVIAWEYDTADKKPSEWFYVGRLVNTDAPV